MLHGNTKMHVLIHFKFFQTVGGQSQTNRAEDAYYTNMHSYPSSVVYGELYALLKTGVLRLSYTWLSSLAVRKVGHGESLGTRNEDQYICVKLQDSAPLFYFSLCRENQHLRHEVSMLKEKHIRQQKVLNKVRALFRIAQ